MSYVSSYIIIENYDGEGFKKVLRKIKSLSQLKRQIKKPKLNEFGTKGFQGGEIRFFALNYFPNDEFLNWIDIQKRNEIITDCQIFVKYEYDEGFWEA